MNERIRELELEAIAYADSKVPVNDRYNDIYHSIVRGKFAELIVLECIKVVDAEEPGYKDYRSQIEVMMRNDCAKALEHKFGLPVNERF